MAQVTRDVLPKAFKPIHYDLEIFNINVLQNTFEGKVKIDLNVVEDSDTIILHADGLKFTSTEIIYTVTKTESSVTVLSTEYDEKKQTATLKLNDTLKAISSSKVQLTIEYTAKIRTNMSGFYRSDYKDNNGKDQVLLSTQFEATDARTSLPCFDEPNLKATFQLTLTLSEDFTALGNTPVLSSKVLDDGKKKGSVEASCLKVVKFQQTPVMSTYLLAWVIGKLDYVEAFTEKSYDGKKIPVRIYTQEGISEQGKFGLEVATKVVDYFSEIFEIDYVLPKLDLVSVPTYSHNAMENWGLITFRPTALLFDEQTSDSKYKQKVAYVVAHELAHQWFGNLVTMDWWDELWLNEGFATWVGYYALEHIFPEWRIFDVYTVTEMQNGFTVDALKSSHPVEVPIQSSSDIDQVFDAISYLKGGAVINQIARSLGVEVFLKGVSKYLKTNKFSNGTTNNLLESISEVSNVDVVTKVNDWIRKIGFPVVFVKENENQDIEFSQQRFLSSAEVSAEDDQTIWWVPLNVSTGVNESDKIENLELTSKSIISESLGKSYFKVNKNTYSFYRVAYDSKPFNTIVSNLDKLSPSDKIGLISDSVVTAAAGLTTTSSYLTLIKALKGETDYIVWTAILESWKLIKGSWFEESAEYSQIQSGLAKFFTDVITPTVLSLDFRVDPSESFLTTQFRSQLLKAAVSAGIPEVLAASKELFENHEKVDPSLKSIIYQAVISAPDATEESFNKIFDIIGNSNSFDTKEIVLASLATVTNPELISKAISLILSEEVAIMDIQFLAYPLAENPKARYALLDYIKNNYEQVYNRLNANPIVFDRFVKFTLHNFSSVEAYSTVESIFAGKNTYGFERSLEQVLESIKGKSSWIKRGKSDVEAWLKEENYI